MVIEHTKRTHPPIPPSARAGLKASRAGLEYARAASAFAVVACPGCSPPNAPEAARMGAPGSTPSSTLNSNYRTPPSVEVATSEL